MIPRNKRTTQRKTGVVKGFANAKAGRPAEQGMSHRAEGFRFAESSLTTLAWMNRRVEG